MIYDGFFTTPHFINEATRRILDTLYTELIR